MATIRKCVDIIILHHVASDTNAYELWHKLNDARGFSLIRDFPRKSCVACFLFCVSAQLLFRSCAIVSHLSVTSESPR